MADLTRKEIDDSDHSEQANLRKQIAKLARKEVRTDNIADYYDKWSNNNDYDKDLSVGGFNSPKMTATAAADGLSDAFKSCAKVFDVAAGTGLCAEQLKKMGFQHIDALDPSKGMLDKAKDKGLDLYERYICDYITEKQLDIEKDTYDVITCSGGFGEGHIPCGALHEMIRVVKPGGYIVIVTRSEYLSNVEEYIGRLEPLMDSLEKEGKWKKVERKLFKGFLLDKEGILWKYQVC